MIWKIWKIKKRDYDKLEDAPRAEDMVIVEHRGVPVTMTQMEKLEYWDQMTKQEKKVRIKTTPTKKKKKKGHLISGQCKKK